MSLRTLQFRLADAVNPNRRPAREEARQNALDAMASLAEAWCDCHDPGVAPAAAQEGFGHAQATARAALTNLSSLGYRADRVTAAAFDRDWTQAVIAGQHRVLAKRLGGLDGAGVFVGFWHGMPHLRQDMLLDPLYRPSNEPLTNADGVKTAQIQDHDPAFTKLKTILTLGTPLYMSTANGLLDANASWRTPGGVCESARYGSRPGPRKP